MIASPSVGLCAWNFPMLKIHIPVEKQRNKDVQHTAVCPAPTLRKEEPEDAARTERSSLPLAVRRLEQQIEALPCSD